jgi:2,4-dienoyl-CoA reductase-like NADH-dependent reductase (Old Yellow Enzyme family)
MSPTAEGFPHLFSEFQLGKLTLRNRIVMAPHSTHYSDEVESELHTEYYARRAAGGVAMIVHEPIIVHPSSHSRPGKVWGFDERNIPHFARTARAVHAHGTAIVSQLIHNGRAMDGFTSGMPAWGPSELQRGGSPDRCHAMTTGEIADVIAGFARSAEICRAGGFDGVEVHASHGYLVQAFLSPLTNHRTDSYGVSQQNRMRLLVEILAAIRASTDDEFVIGVRLAGDEGVAGGLGPGDMTDMAQALSDDVQYLSIVSGHTPTFDRIVPDMSFPRGLNVGYAERIKKRVGDLPVLVTGRIAEPADAEKVLADGSADLIGLARALIADEAWAAKAAGDAVPEIRPCSYANECRDSIGGRRSMTCMVNPDNGHPVRTVAVLPLRRRILVVGGGIAGLECATAAAERGAEVVLVEAAAAFGGQTALAALAPGRSELGRIVDHLRWRVEHSAIELELGRTADADWLFEQRPDHVVIATGARPIPLSGAAVGGVHAQTAIGGSLGTGEGRVVVYDDAGSNSWPYWSAVEAAAESGAEVIAVMPYANVGVGIEAASVPPLLRRLANHGVEFRTCLRLADVSDGNARFVHTYAGSSTTIDGVTAVVVESGVASDAQLPTKLAELGMTVDVIGDALAPRRMMDAIREGRAAAKAFK